MKAITIDNRIQIIRNIEKRIKEEFDTPSRRRFDVHTTYLNGNRPSTNFYFDVTKPINLTFGFSMRFEPRYVNQMKPGEIERLKAIFENENDGRCRLYVKETESRYHTGKILKVELTMLSILEYEEGTVELLKEQVIY